eukprot:1178892-Prorocentrum_minimum.AAC.4
MGSVPPMGGCGCGSDVNHSDFQKIFLINTYSGLTQTKLMQRLLGERLSLAKTKLILQSMHRELEHLHDLRHTPRDRRQMIQRHWAIGLYPSEAKHTVKYTRVKTPWRHTSLSLGVCRRVWRCSSSRCMLCKISFVIAKLSRSPRSLCISFVCVLIRN